MKGSVSSKMPADKNILNALTNQNGSFSWIDDAVVGVDANTHTKTIKDFLFFLKEACVPIWTSCRSLLTLHQHWFCFEIQEGDDDDDDDDLSAFSTSVPKPRHLIIHDWDIGHNKD
jgi:hypothetical protein